MKFFIENKELDVTVREIRRKIKALMNGVVADSMKEKGIVYKLNFGTDIPHLRDLAGKYESSHDLAQRLWALNIRETMILATLLEPIESFSEKTADEWMKSVTNIELAEQICMNLLSKLPYSRELSSALTESDKDWYKITGFNLGARLWKDFSEEEVKKMIQVGIENSKSDNFYVYRAVAVCLSRLCRRDKETADNIREQITDFEHSDCLSEKYIAGEISDEISFFYF
ncbi:MAG: DNA alkylation repair protein [Paludibacteraceae bacterium]